DLPRGAAREFDAVVDAPGHEEHEADEHDRTRDREGHPAPFDEIVVGVREESDHQMLRVTRSGRRCSQIRKRVFTTKIAEIIEAMMPMISVIAKPCTGPVPTAYRMRAVRIVLTFESTIAFIAWRKPSSTARRSDLPCTSSSRMRSKISTFASTAMPIDSTKPANPGSVSVNRNMARPARVNRQYRVSAATASAPESR